VIRNVLIVVPPLVNSGEEDLDPSRPDFEAYRLVSPIEPTSVAADLERRGFDAGVIDLGTYTEGRFEALEERVAARPPDAVVIVQSIMTFATAQDWDGKRVFDIARTVRPGVVTVLTGGHATNYPGEAVQAGIADYSIRGEVDFAVGDLLDAVNSDGDLSGHVGLSYRTKGGNVSVSEVYPAVDVAKLPRPAYHLLDPAQKDRYSTILERAKIRYPAKSPHYRDIMTSRSCILRCSFCSVAHLRGETQRYRRKPLGLVINEIEDALADGIEEIHFFDDLFAQSEEQILTFTNELTRRNLRFHWFVGQGMPMWPLTKDALAAMQATGMYRLICPLESGSNRVLKSVIGKGFSTVEHHHNVITWAHDLGLEIIGMYVVGLPGETRPEILDTVTFAYAHPQVDYSVFSIATPMIGTRLMKQVTEQGRLDDQDKINRVIKRTVALYETDAFHAYEMGIIRAFDWDNVNFATQERRDKYATMVGLSAEELDIVREYSKKTFYRFFPDYDGPKSFLDLYAQPGLFRELEPLIPQKHE